MDLEKIGKQIAALRKERGYTGEKLAEQLQVSPQAVSKWENGKCLPETAILPDLAKALDSSSCEIVYNTIKTSGVSTPMLRKEQITLLRDIMALEQENCRFAEKIRAAL